MRKYLPLAGCVAGYACAIWVLMDGIWLVGWAFDWSPAVTLSRALFQTVPETWGLRLGILAISLPALVFGVLAVVVPFLQLPSEGQVNLDNERGKIRISAKTISNYLQRKSAEVEGVESLRVRVETAEDGGTSLHVEASLFADEPLPVVTQRIQTFIESEIHSTIGLGRVEGVHIHIRRIAGLRFPRLEGPQEPARSREESGKDEAVEVPTSSPSSNHD